MRRKFATNLILLLALNLLVKPFWIFGIDRTVQNIVGAGEYGLFFALFNFSFLLNILLDFGLTNYNNREISRHSQLLPRFFSNMMVIKAMMSVAYIAVSFVFALILGYSGRQLWLLCFLAFNQLLSSLIMYLRSNISGLQFFKTDSLLSVTDRILMIIFSGILIWGPLREKFRIEWFVYAQTLSYSIAALISFILVFRSAKTFRPHFDRAFLIAIVKQSYPYALLVLLMSFYYRIDTVMLERMLPNGDIESGIYAQAFRLLDAANMVPYLFAGLLLPMFSKMIKNGETVQPLLGFAFSLLIVTSFSFAVACFTYRDPIMDTLYVHHPKESSVVLGILMISFVFISVTYIFGTLLTANGSLRQLNIISAVGVVINIGLNLILIPKYYVIGAAIASVFTQFTMALLQVLASFRMFKINVKGKQLWQFFFFTAGCIALMLVSIKLFSFWLLGFLFLLGGSFMLALVVRIFKVSDILKLLVQK